MSIDNQGFCESKGDLFSWQGFVFCFIVEKPSHLHQFRRACIIILRGVGGK